MSRSTGKHTAIGRTTGSHAAIKQRVLVIDDQPEIARLVAKMLGRGYDVIAAEDGAAGLIRAGTDLPDLVLLDLNMPKLDGWEVCRLLKKDPKTKAIPIVMMTASETTPEDAAHALKLGAAEYLVKPFVREVLIHNVQRILKDRI
jgi:CheY-like chemotaxis protein